MNHELHAKCACQHCGTHIEFPLEAAGMTHPCPHCQQPTELSLEAPPAVDASRPTAPEILNAFQSGGIRPNRAGFLYQVGLLLATLVMVILPLVYLAMVAGAGWAVYYYAVHCGFLVTSMSGGPKLYLVKLFLYLVPLFIGALVLFFMVKPLFARRAKRAQPLALNPAVESTLFAFIARICEEVGAPMPTRIDLICDLNAAAGFRRGVASMFGHDLVLRIGVPLVAGLNMQQFAGVIAHEFGHFTQGFGMRSSYLIRRVNAWFARVVYERDAWDMWLANWVAEAEDWQSLLVVGIAHIAVGCTRLLLKLLMYFGHGCCCFLMRQMEYDADSYDYKLAGSATFEETTKRLRVLAEASDQSYQSMRAAWKLKRILPDNFPAFLTRQESKITDARRTLIEDSVGLSRTGVFHSHPSDGDRIRRARQAAEPGIFHLTHPASLLFANFETVSKQITFLHYTDDIGLVFNPSALQPVNAPES